MATLRSLLAFSYDFLVGDDWMVAAGIVIALALTAVLVTLGVRAWWLLPLALLGLLALSLARAVRRSA